MAVSGKWFSQAFGALGNKEIDFGSDEFKVMLCTSTYTPDQDAHAYQDDVTNEVSGTGYTAGGEVIANTTWTYTAGSNTWALDGDDVSWPGSTITARHAVIYDNTPALASAKPLIGYQDFGADQSTSGATFSLQWNASGIVSVVVS